MTTPAAVATVETADPATGRRLAGYDAHGWPDVDRVLSQAQEAFGGWAATAVGARASLVRRVGELLAQRREDYARLITAEMGKPLPEARAEIDKCAWNCAVVAQHGPAWLADHEVTSTSTRSWLSYEPLGTVFAVMPWNFPFRQVLRFAGAPLVAGNAAVLKHAPNVTGCALAIESLISDAGAPDGLFRAVVLPESAVPEMVPRIIADPRVAAVTLTGSERAGAAVGAAAGAALKKSVLELGGCDPFVVLADAGLPAAADAAVRSRFGNAGQSCIAAKRFIVAGAVADEFVALVVERVRALRVGDPTADGTTVGLGAAVWGAPERALAVGRRIRSGALFVNAVVASDPLLPFGGTGRSGYGRELSAEGTREFTNVRTVVVGDAGAPLPVVTE